MERKLPNQLKQALSIISGLKENMPESNLNLVDEKFAIEFNSCVNDIEKYYEYDLNRYKISPQDILPRLISSNSRNGKQYSSQRYCNRSLLLTKIDALLILVKIEPKEIEIGFNIK